jgi:hypothetical protein
MITDQFLRVSNAQAVTTTAVSTDSVDLGTARDIGEGQDLYIVFSVGTAFAGGTSIQFEAITADNGALTTNPTVVGASRVVPTANLTASSQFAVRVNPVIGSTGRRFFGARYTVVGTMSAGTVTADVVTDIQDGQKYYASGFSVV